MRILHVLYQSEPNISGSSTRTKDILINQNNIGITPVAITSPFQRGFEINNGVEILDGIKFYRTYSGVRNEEVKEDANGFYTKIRKFLRILSFRKNILKVVALEKPDIIHAHAMFFCALPSIRIGHQIGIPVVYEIRSLWEERRKDSAPYNIIRKLEFAILRNLETYCMKRATHVVAINESLKKEIVNRGISPDKITVVGNAVDIDFINSQKEKCKSNLTNEINFGYIGSISPIEGLSSLVKLFKEKLTGYKLMIYGNGKESEIKKLVDEINDSYNIHYYGAINRNEVYKAYENIDVIVNPRVKLKITDSVTPLKPLEAMAFGKVVIASDVGGMRELIENNITGLMFEADNSLDLEKCLLRVADMSNSEREMMKSNAIDYINKNRLWASNAELYRKLYQRINS
jgi:glycogen(starch) synthase